MPKTQIPMAIVEIEIDNSDLHFPITDKQLVVRRQLTKNSDQYFINGNQGNYHSFQTILETGGFSANNSYYLVKQGVITEIALSSNQYLLEVLKGIGGADTYDDRKNSSLKLLKNTEQEFEILKTKIQTAENKLKLLNIDVKLLEEFQELDAVHKYLQARYNKMEAIKYDEMAKKEIIECQRHSQSLQSAYNEVSQILMQIELKEKKFNEIKPALEINKGMLEEKRCLIEELTNQIARSPNDFNLQLDPIDENSQTIENIDEQIKSTKIVLQDIEKQLENLRVNSSAARKKLLNLERKRNNLLLLRRLTSNINDAALQQFIDKVLEDLDKESKHLQQLKINCDKLFNDINEKVKSFADYDIEFNAKIQQRRECMEKIDFLKQKQAEGNLLYR